MLINFTINDFCRLQKGDTILININGSPETAIVKNYAFYNTDANEPGWEIETDYGYISIDSAYKEITSKTIKEVRPMQLDEFKKLKPGCIIFIPRNTIFEPVVATDKAFKSTTLDNILGDGEAWEVETNFGFVHNNSAYTTTV